MKLKVVIQKAAEGGYRAEVPATPDCATQGTSLNELLERLYEQVEARLAADPSDPEALRRNVVLEPVGVDAAEFVRAKLAKSGIDQADVKDAVAWARGHQ